MVNGIPADDGCSNLRFTMLTGKRYNLMWMTGNEKWEVPVEHGGPWVYAGLPVEFQEED